MVTIAVAATDLTRLKVILSAMKKGKWELEGEEVLAFAQAFGWAAEVHERISIALKTEPSLPIDQVTYKTSPKAKSKK